MPSVVNVNIQWCGGWGYEKHYKSALNDLGKQFGESVHVISQKDSGITGNFEISVEGKLVHSKKAGAGFLDTQEKLTALYEAIYEYIAPVEDADEPLLHSQIQVKKSSDIGQNADGAEDIAQASRRSLIVSILTLLLSIPALIGAWCWPALVVALVSGSVSAAARSLGHLISLIITILMMAVVNGFMVYTLKNRDPSRGKCFYYGPLALTLTATPLILADIIRHVLQDNGIWKECDRPDDLIWDSRCNWSSSQYHCTTLPPHCIPTAKENMFHLSPMGVLFTICFTYMGFACLMVGTLWNANICEKLKDLRTQWNEIRQGMA